MLSQDILENIDRVPNNHKEENMIILKEYLRFIGTSENEFNCENCPESPDSSSQCIMDNNGNYPCGQNQCWVTIMQKKG